MSLPSFTADDRIIANREAIMDWMTDRQYADPYWASTEMDVRRMAQEVIEAFWGPTAKQTSISLALSRPGGSSFTTLTFYKHSLEYYGGLEGTLAVEEQIRRAMGFSREQKLEQRLRTIKQAL